MADVVIENPILNSPFREPSRHFRFGDEGITSEIVEERRVSSYFMPIAAARKKPQLQLDTEWTRDRIEENKEINRIRERVDLWRKGGWVGITPTTRNLLEYWADPDREKPLFFCQIEALETAIYLTEVARRHGDTWIDNGDSPCTCNGVPFVADKNVIERRAAVGALINLTVVTCASHCPEMLTGPSSAYSVGEVRVMGELEANG